MPALLSPIAKVLLWWLVVFLCLTGVGLLLRRAMGRKTGSLWPLFVSFWVGWGTSIAFLQIWHLFFRVGFVPVLAILAVGAGGLAWNARDLRPWLAGTFVRERRLASLAWAVAFVVTAVLIADFAIGPTAIYDTGLYHLNAIRWTTDHPIVPGLGNLHSRFAFNNSSFLYMALLETGPWRGGSRHLGNGILLVVLMAQVLWSARKVFNPRDPLRVRHIFLALFFLPVLANGCLYASSASPDLPVYALGVVAASLLLTLMSRPEADADEDGFHVFTVCLLSAVGLTVKVSFAVFGFASALVALWWWIGKRRALVERRERRTVALAALTTTLVLLPWMLRGVFLSGYPFYPSSFAPAPVEWRLPAPSVVRTKRRIYSWARTPRAPTEEVLGNWKWLGPWWRRLVDDRVGFRGPAILFAFGVVVLLVSLRARISRAPPSLASWLLLLPAGLSILFWFATAPDIRFLGASFWVLSAGLTGLAMRRIDREGRAFRCVFVIYVALCAWSLQYGLRVARKNVVGPGSDGGFHPVPVATMKEIETDSGLVLHVLDGPAGGQCWDAPLPCAPAANRRLRLRRRGDLGSGFVIDRGPGK